MLRNQNPIFDRLKVVALPDTGNNESSSKFQESVIQRKKITIDIDFTKNEHKKLTGR